MQTTTPMFVARQPILNAQENTFGYELLFRSSMENVFQHPDGDQATLSVIDSSFFNMGLKRIAGGKKVFINCNAYLLASGHLELLPKDQVVIEILEDVEPTRHVLAAVGALREQGFCLALDDYYVGSPQDALAAMVDIIKVDFLQNDGEGRQYLARTLLPTGAQLLAEKVETQADYGEARGLGYSLFQGFFFSKPVILSSDRPTTTKLVRSQLLREVTRPDLDLDQTEAVIKREPLLTASLLRLINSSAFGIRNEIHSIRQAIVLLGHKQLRNWAVLLCLSGLGAGKPHELVRQTVIRARFCELAAVPFGEKELDQEYFLAGSLSTADALFDAPLLDIMDELPLPESVCDAVLGSADSLMTEALALIKAIERGDWDKVEAIESRHNISADGLFELYQGAIEWGEEVAALAQG